MKPSISGLYIHVPFCDGKCDYCAFYSVPYDPVMARRYAEALERELTGWVQVYGPLAVETVYVGGGTPTLVSGEVLREFFERVRSAVNCSGLREWTIEANPGTLTEQLLEFLGEASVNRISVGVQAFDDATLGILGRRHSAADARAACDRLKRVQWVNWSVDLIAGVPGQGAGVWRDTLLQAMDFGPPHLSVYALTFEEGSRLAARATAGHIASLSDEEQLDRLHEAQDFLSRQGYERYEISNFARSGFACLHNLACWRGREYLGIGCAASSHVAGRRWTNAPDIAAYLAAVEAGRPPPRSEDESFSPAARALERLIFGLRMAEGVNLEEIARSLGDRGIAMASEWQQRLTALAGQGLVTDHAGRWFLKEHGCDLADLVARELMP